MRKTLISVLVGLSVACLVGLAPTVSAMKGPAGHEQITYDTVATSAASPVCAATLLTTNIAVSVTITNQPTPPRNIILYMTDANASVSILDMTVVGKNQYGETVKQNFRMTSAAVTVAARNEGSVPFGIVSTVTINAGTTGYNASSDTVRLGYGNKLGLVTPLFKTTDVTKVTTSTAFGDAVSYNDPTDYTVDVTYGTIKPVSVTATEVIDVWTRPSSNKPVRQQRMRRSHTSSSY